MNLHWKRFRPSWLCAVTVAAHVVCGLCWRRVCLGRSGAGVEDGLDRRTDEHRQQHLLITYGKSRAGTRVISSTKSEINVGTAKKADGGNVVLTAIKSVSRRR